jgi:hypothetical protein
MLGYSLIIVCGLIMTLEALTGFVVAAHPQIRSRSSLGFKLAFIAFAVVGIFALAWAGLRAKQTYWQRPGVVDIELSANQADVQLQRVATLLGVDPHQSDAVMGDNIVKRLSNHQWHLTTTQTKAFEQALDQVPEKERFRIVVRSIPSSASSVAFSDDIIAILRDHQWTVENRRDFGIKQSLNGIVIAVPSTVRAEDQMPTDAKILIVMLEKAGITPYGGVIKDLRPGEFQLVIGNEPK